MICRTIRNLSSPLLNKKGLGVVLFLFMWSTGLMAQDADPFPEVNPHDFYGSMIMSVKVAQNNETLTQDVIVAVYVDDQIRGKGRPQDDTNPGVVCLTVYGNKNGERLTFKVYTGGEILEADRAITYSFNGVFGSPQSPYVLDLTPLPPYTGITIKYSEGKRIAMFDGTSEEDINIPEPLVVDSVEFDRLFTPNQYAAVILPFDINNSTSFFGGEFFKFTNVTHEGDKWVASMTIVNKLEANHPYLFIPSEEQLVFDFDGQPITLKTDIVESESKNGWTFWGTYKKLVWTEESTDYGFSAKDAEGNTKREFVRFSDGDYILPLRCYLSYTGGDVPQETRRRYTDSAKLPDSIEIRLLDEDGNPYGGVGIKSINNEQLTMNNGSAVYDLSGRKMFNGAKKGIFIVNGKKVFTGM